MNSTALLDPAEVRLGSDSKADEAAVKAIRCVIGVVKGPQTQVIVGSKVAEVFDAVEKLRSGQTGAGSNLETHRPMSWRHSGSTMMDFIVSVFTPIIPAIAIPDGTLKLTDLVLNNLQGDFGRLRLELDGVPLLAMALEHFRDMDYHFLSPVRVAAGQNWNLTMSCHRVGHCPLSLHLPNASGLPSSAER